MVRTRSRGEPKVLEQDDGGPLPPENLADLAPNAPAKLTCTLSGERL